MITPFSTFILTVLLLQLMTLSTQNIKGVVIMCTPNSHIPLTYPLANPNSLIHISEDILSNN